MPEEEVDPCTLGELPTLLAAFELLLDPGLVLEWTPDLPDIPVLAPQLMLDGLLALIGLELDVTLEFDAELGIVFEMPGVELPSLDLVLGAIIDLVIAMAAIPVAMITYAIEVAVDPSLPALDIPELIIASLSLAPLTIDAAIEVTGCVAAALGVEV